MLGVRARAFRPNARWVAGFRPTEVGADGAADWLHAACAFAADRRKSPVRIRHEEISR